MLMGSVSMITRISDKRKRRYYQILTLLYLGITHQSRLTKIMRLSKAWISELLSNMERDGLIKRINIGSTNIVAISKKGKELIARYHVGWSLESIKLLIRGIMEHLGISFNENKNYDGISFDFEIALRPIKLIKIVEGLAVPRDKEVLENLESILSDNSILEILRYDMLEYTQHFWGYELIDILRNLIDEKGLILTIKDYASSNPNKDILLIIAGSHPDSWPEIMVRFINWLGNITNQMIAIDADKALKRILRHLPRNFEVIFVQELGVGELSSRIKLFVKGKPKAEV